MKVLFVRPPRYYWPFNSESSAFWQPLGFASMAAVLRENDIDVRIIDCLPNKIGWKSLRKLLERLSFDVLCAGEEVSSIKQGLQLIELVKEVKPKTKVIVGGYFFTHMTDYLLKYPIDFIVKHEGEETLLELVKAIDSGTKDFKKVKGIAYESKGLVIETKFRPPIKDLDSLPLPAYDLLPMDKYGKGSTNHPNLVAIEHSRGCIDNCEFCTLWKQMPAKRDGKMVSCYRQKSAERCFEEVEMLNKKYKRKTFGWVDGTWNADIKWNKDFSQMVIDNNLDIWQTAWIRSDSVIRDEKHGVLKKEIEAGLVQTMVGIERLDNQGLLDFNKTNNQKTTSFKALKILNKYPSVYKIASVVYGVPNETVGNLAKLTSLTFNPNIDQVFYIPFTPFPGTKYYDPTKKYDFATFNFHRPIKHASNMSTDKLELWIKGMIARYFLFPDNIYRGLVKKRSKRVKNIQKSMNKALLKIILNNASLWKRSKDKYGIVPKWYYD